MTPATTTRRRFLGRGRRPWARCPSWADGQCWTLAGEVQVKEGADAAAAAKRIDRAVAFLRPRQDAKGGWSTQREPGVTALVVTALLRSGRVVARRSGGHQGPDLSGRLHRSQRRRLGVGPRQLHDVDRAGGLQRGQSQRPVRPRDQGRADLPQDDAVGRVRGQGPRRRVLRGRGLRRSQQPARPVEHGLLHGGPPRHRAARGRPQPQEGADLRLAVPEPEGRVQRPGMGRQGQRRRLRLQYRPRRREHGWQDRRRRACARTPA